MVQSFFVKIFKDNMYYVTCNTEFNMLGNCEDLGLGAVTPVLSVRFDIGQLCSGNFKTD
jgi:hypothetical protein